MAVFLFTAICLKTGRGFFIFMEAEEFLTSQIRAINPEWDYGATHSEVFWQLHHLFDSEVVRRYIVKYMDAYAEKYHLDKIREVCCFCNKPIIQHARTHDTGATICYPK